MQPEDKEADIQKGSLFLPEQSRQADFTLVPEASLKLQLLDARNRPLSNRRVELKGAVAAPVYLLDHHVTDNDGLVGLPGIPVNHPHRLDLTVVRSAPLTFPSGGNYDVVAQLQIDPSTGVQKLVIVSVKNDRGKEVRNQIVGKVPLPEQEDANLRADGLAVLRKVQLANRYWIGIPPKETKRYSYEFEYHDGVTRRIEVDDPAASSLNKLRGITFFSPLDAVVRDLSNVIIDSVNQHGDVIELEWRVRRSFQAAAGFGQRGRYYGGYFAQRLDGGTFVIDAKTHALLKCHADDLTETYSKYVEIRDGHYVPLKIVIDFKHDSWTPFEWNFRVHEPGLWLFENGTRKTGDKTYTAVVSNVAVNEAKR